MLSAQACEEIDDNATAAQVIECVASLKQEIEILKREAGTVPRGGVMAFSRSDGCPSGWSEFEESQGRFIIGVDRSKFRLPFEGGKPVYQTGGSPTHTLTEDEMPRHRHPVRYGPGAELGQGPILYLLAKGGLESATAYVGGASPHNNMPPFIALYYCKKE